MKNVKVGFEYGLGATIGCAFGVVVCQVCTNMVRKAIKAAEEKQND